MKNAIGASQAMSDNAQTAGMSPEQTTVNASSLRTKNSWLRWTKQLPVYVARR